MATRTNTWAPSEFHAEHALFAECTTLLRRAPAGPRSRCRPRARRRRRARIATSLLPRTGPETTKPAPERGFLAIGAPGFESVPGGPGPGDASAREGGVRGTSEHRGSARLPLAVGRGACATIRPAGRGLTDVAGGLAHRALRRRRRRAMHRQVARPGEALVLATAPRPGLRGSPAVPRSCRSARPGDPGRRRSRADTDGRWECDAGHRPGSTSSHRGSGRRSRG